MQFAIGILVGAVGILATYLAYQRGPSQKKQDEGLALQRTGLVILAQSRFTAELDDPIQRLFFVLRLFDTNQISSLCPLDGGLIVSKLGDQGELRGFGFRFQDEESGIHVANDTSGKSASFGLSLCSFDAEGHSKVHHRVFDTRRAFVKTLGFPIQTWALGGKPFRTVRDLHAAQLVAYFSNSLTGKVEKIELVVNGWTVFETKLEGTASRADVVRESPFNGDAPLNALLVTTNMSRPPSASWILDLHRGNIPFNPDAAGPLTLWDKTDIQILPATQNHR